MMIKGDMQISVTINIDNVECDWGEVYMHPYGSINISPNHVDDCGRYALDRDFDFFPHRGSNGQIVGVCKQTGQKIFVRV